MHALADKRVLVIGLDASGRAACDLLSRCGAKVLALDTENTESLQREAESLRATGVEVRLGAATLPSRPFELAVFSPALSRESSLLQKLARRRVPIIGELELGFQQSLCPNISVTGTNGKTTTTELILRLLTHAHRKTVLAGGPDQPLCAVADQTKDLDFLTLQVSCFQLESIQYFRPSVAVVLNLAPDHLDRYASMAERIRAHARLFSNQQPFDWAIIQSEALAQFRSLNLAVTAKTITFSANNWRADIYFDRGLLISRLPGWTGPLLDVDKSQLRGPHNAENLMAALAVGRVLRLPLESMAEALTTYEPAAHRCEFVAEVNGVKFINDAKSANLDALHKALLAMPSGQAGEPNVWLIAGGEDKGFDYHDIGPLLSRRVKGAFLMGEAREKMRAAWSLFTPCAHVDSLLEAVSQAAESAVCGDVILLSPACSSFDKSQNYQHRGEVFRQAVEHWQRTRNSGLGRRDTSDCGMATKTIEHVQHDF